MNDPKRGTCRRHYDEMNDHPYTLPKRCLVEMSQFLLSFS